MQHQLNLTEVNALDESTFVELFGSVYEHTPEVATEAWKARPFSDLTALTRAMQSVVANFTEAQQLELIRKHPQLGRAAGLTPASREEQSGAGLTQLEQDKAVELHHLNQEYQRRFEFPFVVAVKLLHGRDVVEVLRSRLLNDVASEMNAALEEIAKIASIRLQSLFSE